MGSALLYLMRRGANASILFLINDDDLTYTKISPSIRNHSGLLWGHLDHFTDSQGLRVRSRGCPVDMGLQRRASLGTTIDTSPKALVTERESDNLPLRAWAGQYCCKHAAPNRRDAAIGQVSDARHLAQAASRVG